MKRSRAVFVFVALAAAWACKGNDKPAPSAGSSASGSSAAVTPIDAAPAPVDAPEAAVVEPTDPPRRMWTGELRNEADMLAYSVEVGGERFTKFVLDTKSNAIYYFDVD